MISMTELNENTQVKANIAFVAKTVALVGTAVWGYSVIWNKINTIEVELMRFRHEIEMNSEFRVKWPRGELGALPDDAEQNMRLSMHDKIITKHEQIIDQLRYPKLPE